MSAFRLFTKLNDFRGLTNQALPGGYLKFYVAGTSTPADMYGEEALTTNNGPTIALDASARPNVDVWGDAAISYDVEVYAADDTLQGSADNLKVPGAGGLTIPTLVDGKWLTTDGAVLLWDTILQLPDPTGQSNKILGVVGDAYALIAKPADGAAGTSDIAIGTGTDSLLFGDGSGDKALQQWGSDTLTAPNSKSGTKSVVFAEAYTATPKVFVQLKGTAPTTGGNVYPHPYLTAVSTTGFTVLVSTLTGGTSADGSATSSVISGNVDFDWFAVGPHA